MAKPIVISILANASQANRTLGQTVTLTQRVGGGFRSMAAPAAGGLAVLTAGALTLKDAASDSEQSIGATETVFKKYADTVIERSEKASQAIGVSANEYRELSNVTGAMLKNSGMPLKKVADLTDQLNTRAADLAATYGGSTKEAVEAVGSLLRGEADPIERYGVSIKQSDVNARLAAQGLGKLTGEARKQAEQQARLDLLFQQTADAAGQFKRESGTAANAEQRNAAKFADARAELGTRLLPAYIALQGVATKTLNVLAQHPDTVVKVTVVLAGLALAVLAVNAAMRVAAAVTATYNAVLIVSSAAQKASTAACLGTRIGLAALAVQSVVTSTATKALAAGQWILNAALTANPIGLVIVGLVALGAGLVIAYKKSATFRAIVQGAFRGVIAGARSLASGVKSALTVAGAVVSVVGKAIGIYLLPARVALRLLGSAASAMAGVVRSRMGAVASTVRAIPGKIKGAFSGAGSLLTGIGGNIVDGLVAGIRAAAGRVADAARSVASKIPGPIRKAMGIASPSKVTKRLGRFIGQGLALGIRLETSTVVKAVRTQGLKTKEQYERNNKAIMRGLLAAAKKRYKTLLDQRNGYARTVANQARDYASLANLTLGENQTLDGASIKQYLADRLAAIRNFQTKLATLKKRGLSRDLYMQIIGMGVEQGGAFADALAKESPASLKEINSLQGKVTGAASALGNRTADSLYKSGVDAARGFYRGLRSYASRIARAGAGIGRALIREVKKALGIRSPSRAFTLIGRQTLDGLLVGMPTNRVRTQGVRLSKALQTGFTNGAMDAQLRAGFAASDTKRNGSTTYNITVRLDASMTEAEMGRAYKRAIKAAESLGIA